jgi:hypothetical protein
MYRSVCVGADPDFCLAKHLALFVWKYRQTYCRLRARLYRQLRLPFDFDLNLDPNLDFYPSLLGALRKSSHKSLLRQLFASLFGSMLAALAFDFYLLTLEFLRAPMPPPRQPLGRPLPGRIVAGKRSTTTYR